MNDIQAVDLLEQLVRTPSVSCDESAASQLLVQQMTALGFEAQLDQAGNPVGLIGDRGPRVVLLGHIDTVPGHIPVGRADGKLYGRGTVDAKGPLAAFVVAAARAAQSGSLQCQVEVVGCLEEEVPSSRGARFRASRPAPDLCINGEPSGWQGVTLGYKGYLRAQLELSLPVEHTAGRNDGAGALACRAYVAIETAAARFNANRKALFDQLFTHLAGIELNHDGLRETAHLDIRMRLPGDLGPEQALGWLQQQAPAWQVKTSDGLAAWSTTRTDPLARLLGRAISSAGGRPRYLRKTGTSDLNVVGPIWRCPIVAYGPGDSSLDHTPNEHIVLDEYLSSIRTLEALLCDPNLAKEVRSTSQETVAPLT